MTEHGSAIACFFYLKSGKVRLIKTLDTVEKKVEYAWEHTTCLRNQVQSQYDSVSKWLLKFRLFHLHV